MREVLRHADHRVVDAGVAVRVVLAEHVADDASRTSCATLPGPRLLLVHREEDAAVHGLQAVAHVGDGAADDDAHRVVEVDACASRPGSRWDLDVLVLGGRCHALRVLVCRGASDGRSAVGAVLAEDPAATLHASNRGRRNQCATTLRRGRDGIAERLCLVRSAGALPACCALAACVAGAGSDRVRCSEAGRPVRRCRDRNDIPSPRLQLADELVSDGLQSPVLGAGRNVRADPRRRVRQRRARSARQRA